MKIDISEGRNVLDVTDVEDGETFECEGQYFIKTDVGNAVNLKSGFQYHIFDFEGVDVYKIKLKVVMDNSSM